MQTQASSKQLVTDEYRDLNSQLHNENEAYGTSGKAHAGMVGSIAMGINAESILDYGCGKQTLQNAMPHLSVIGYDPCIEGLDERPQPADLVTCTDVMEHIEPDLLDNVLDDLQFLTKKVLFVSVATRPAVKVLADGRNAHLIVEDYKWWMPKFLERFTLDSFNRVSKGEFIMTLSNKDWNNG